MGKMIIIRTDDSETEEDAPDVYDGQRDFSDRLKEIVGGWIEHVHVLYEGRPIYMMVNETGAIQDPPLPVNHKATRIYYTAWAQRKGLDIDTAISLLGSRIHGDVALLTEVRVE